MDIPILAGDVDDVTETRSLSQIFNETSTTAGKIVPESIEDVVLSRDSQNIDPQNVDMSETVGEIMTSNSKSSIDGVSNVMNTQEETTGSMTYNSNIRQKDEDSDVINVIIPANDGSGTTVSGEVYPDKLRPHHQESACDSTFVTNHSNDNNTAAPYGACFRCSLRVYPVEKVDIGLLFHRRCFRCKVCNVQLTLRTFCLDRENKSEIFCRMHTPRFVGTIDQECVGIKSALNTPKAHDLRNDQIRGSGAPGWTYDPKALEFEHYKGLGDRHTRSHDNTTYAKFEEMGVFAAQNELEKLQKEEEDRLYKIIRDERTEQIRRVDTELGLDESYDTFLTSEDDVNSSTYKDHTAYKDHEPTTERHGDDVVTLKKERDKRVERLIRRMSVEERRKVSDLIDKHSQEMLVMIGEKLAVTEQAEDSQAGSDPQSTTLPTVPAVYPPEVKRRTLFNNPTIFEDIDRHVCEIAQNEYLTFTSLVRDLIRDCLTNLEKARAIFLWITLKDLNALEISATIAADSPYGILRGIQFGTESYHHLFKRLCSYAGLFCEVIQGHSKAAGYKPGMPVIDSRFRNSWTAVSIDGSWQFVNCNWGARHVKGYRDSVVDHNRHDILTHDTLHYAFDEFYFITDPEDHIFQHFPDCPEWQLLECPITEEDFIDLPVVKSPFFNFGLRFSQYYECVLQSDDGFVEVIITVPRSIIFGHTLVAVDCADSPPITGRVLLRVVGDKAIFTIAPPTPGLYYFTIFAKLEINSSLQSACSFKIKCDASLPESSCFPNLSAFGPVVSTYKYIAIPITHKDPLITTIGEDLTLEFTLLQQFKSCHSFHLFTHNNNKSYVFDDMRQYSFMQFADSDRLSFRLRFPRAGFYIFNLNAAPPSALETGTQSTYECVFRYLIKCETPLHMYPDTLPRACHRWTGCRLINPSNGNLKRNQNVLFQIEAPKACDVAVMIGDAWFHLERCGKLWEGHVFTGHQPKKARVYARLNSSTSRYSPLLEFVIP